jgi:hypothetical protein
MHVELKLKSNTYKQYVKIKNIVCCNNKKDTKMTTTNNYNREHNDYNKEHNAYKKYDKKMQT